MKWLFPGLAVLLAPTAGLAEYQSDLLFQRGAWSVVLTYDSVDNDFWCSGETTNRAGQKLSVTAYSNANAQLFVFDGTWALAPRGVRFIVDVDYERWTMDGFAEGIGVSVQMAGQASAGRFVEQLASSQAVAVYNEGGTQLATFSLDGSRAALQSLLQCWDRILATDPFGRASDPF